MTSEQMPSSPQNYPHCSLMLKSRSNCSVLRNGVSVVFSVHFPKSPKLANLLYTLVFINLSKEEKIQEPENIVK